MSSFIVGLRWVAILASHFINSDRWLWQTANVRPACGYCPLMVDQGGMGHQAIPMVRPPEHLLLLPEENRAPGRAPGTKSDTRPFRRTFCAAELPTHPSPQSSRDGPIFRDYHLWNRRRRGAVLD